jgi:hypothetical protein
MPVLTSALNVGEPKALWYPENGSNTIVVGRPDFVEALPEHHEVAFWALSDVSRFYSRRILSLNCAANGALVIKRLSGSNPIRISSDSNPQGDYLEPGQRYLVPHYELYSLTVLIRGFVTLKALAVGQVGVERSRLLTLVRTR